jgi:uncharacterized protein (TIGR02001 family)
MRKESTSSTRGFAAAVVLLIVLLLIPIANNAAQAEPSGDNAPSSIILGDRGGLTPEPSVMVPTQEGTTPSIEVGARAGFATDYIYRGVTLSDHKPAVGAGIEAVLGPLYAGTTFTSVKLPNEHTVELTAATGVRPKLWNIDWDFGWTYFAYPGGSPLGPGINYWEVGGRADTKLTEWLHLAAGFAYSPNFSNTGAWSKYAASGLGADLPSAVLPQGVAGTVTAGVGYYWFGNQSAALGGFALPAYFNWNAGITFKRKIFSLDLRYYDTNLSKENCFVFTGDPNATPGGQANPLTNPEGLTSGWCSATFVAKFGFELD